MMDRGVLLSWQESRDRDDAMMASDVLRQQSLVLQQLDDQLKRAKERAEAAEAALAARETPCPWKRVGNYLGSACGYLTTFTAEEFLFCPGCGHPVQEVQP